jgi:hypothetical protein
MLLVRIWSNAAGVLYELGGNRDGVVSLDVGTASTYGVVSMPRFDRQPALAI